MGGAQAALVLSQVKKQQAHHHWTQEEERAFIKKIEMQYEQQGHPYFSSARLWDDGIIDPASTRDVLGLALKAASYAPIEQTHFGLFRM